MYSPSVQVNRCVATATEQSLRLHRTLGNNVTSRVQMSFGAAIGMPEAPTGYAEPPPSQSFGGTVTSVILGVAVPGCEVLIAGS
jgi:hypothetical protein